VQRTAFSSDFKSKMTSKAMHAQILDSAEMSVNSSPTSSTLKRKELNLSSSSTSTPSSSTSNSSSSTSSPYSSTLVPYSSTLAPYPATSKQQSSTPALNIQYSSTSATAYYSFDSKLTKLRMPYTALAIKRIYEMTFPCSVANLSVESERIAREFTNFTMFIHSSKAPKFNYEKLKTCTEEERQRCAGIILENAIHNKDSAVKLAIIAREIFEFKCPEITSFAMFFCSLVEEKINEMFLDSSWDDIDGLGIYLAQLYVQGAMNHQFVTKWLNTVYQMYMRSFSEKDCDVQKHLIDLRFIQSLMTVLRLIMAKLKEEEVKTHKFYSQQIQKFHDSEKIPEKFVDWSLKEVGVENTKSLVNIVKTFKTEKLNCQEMLTRLQRIVNRRMNQNKNSLKIIRTTWICLLSKGHVAKTTEKKALVSAIEESLFQSFQRIFNRPLTSNSSDMEIKLITTAACNFIEELFLQSVISEVSFMKLLEVLRVHAENDQEVSFMFFNEFIESNQNIIVNCRRSEAFVKILTDAQETLSKQYKENSPNWMNKYIEKSYGILTVALWKQNLKNTEVLEESDDEDNEDDEGTTSRITRRKLLPKSVQTQKSVLGKDVNEVLNVTNESDPKTRRSRNTSSTSPVKPSSTSPVKPSSTSSVNTSGTSPVNTSGTSPVKLSSTSKVKSSSTSPLKSSSTSPVKPSSTSPVKPSSASNGEASKSPPSEFFSKLSTFCTNLSFHNQVEVHNLIVSLNLRNENSIKSFAQSFLEVAIKIDNSEVVAKLSLLIDSEFSTRNIKIRAVFKETLRNSVPNCFYSTFSPPNMDKECKNRTKSLAKLYGQLYNLNWYRVENLFKMFSKIAARNFEIFFELELFHELLKIVSHELMINCDFEKCQELLESIRKLKFKDKNKRKLAKNVVETLEKIIAGREKVEEIVEEQVMEENVEPTAEPTAESTAEENVVPIAEPTAEPTTEPTAEENFVPTAEPTTEENGVPTAETTAEPTAKENFVPIAEPTAEPTTKENTENDDHQSSEKVVKQKSKDIVKETCIGVKETKMTSKTKSTQYRKPEKRNSVFDNNSILKALNKLTAENMQFTSTYLARIVGEKRTTFVQFLWKFAVIYAESANLYSQLCVEIMSQQNDATLSDDFNDYLQLQSSYFTSLIVNNQLQPTAIKTLENAMIFVFKLYKSNIISDETFTTWLKPEILENLSSDFLEHFRSTINSVVIRKESVPLKSSFKSLDDVLHEKTMNTLKEMQNDLDDLVTIMYDFVK
jgi:hypothetical protein